MTSKIRKRTALRDKRTGEISVMSRDNPLVFLTDEQIKSGDYIPRQKEEKRRKMICRHEVEGALCIVAECRAKGLTEVIRRLVEVGSPHEDRDCPEDDSCECGLAAMVNRILERQER